MTPDPSFGYEQLMTELIRGVIDSVADIPGLSESRRLIKQQAVACSVLSLQPRDPIETMLAGQCVIYDHMLRDGARDLSRGQSESLRLRARPGTVACGKMFLSTLTALQRMQKRATETLVVPMKAAEEAPPEAEVVPVPMPAVAIEAVPPRPEARTVPVPPRARPRFVCQRVHVPRSQQLANAPRIGAAYRLPGEGAKVPSPLCDRLRGSVSHAAMLIDARPGGFPIGWLVDDQAVTVSTARTQRAIDPLEEIDTGISPRRQASRA